VVVLASAICVVVAVGLTALGLGSRADSTLAADEPVYFATWYRPPSTL
jgi:hypothetical protein